jgi:hypothetical protein
LSAVVSNETPSGLKVEYCPDPRQYWVNSVEVPSVTTVLDVLRKDALTWWGQKIGIQGCIELSSMGILTLEGKPNENPALLDQIIDKMKEHKLTTNHMRDKAADRGLSVHQGFEDWCRTGHKPDPQNFPPQEAGYVEGLLKFIEQVAPEPIHTEIMVGSARHWFAGRVDLMGRTTNSMEVQTGPRTKRLIPLGTGLWDLKTSKGIYMSHKLQLAGYRLACEESGYGRMDYEAIILVRENGTYDFKVSDATPDQFLAVRQAYSAVQGL